jgi:hypothetical protein
VREERSKYYQENKESINRKRREKRQKAKELKVARQNVPDGETSVTDNIATKKYDWALYKRRQRARAKEEIKRKEKIKRKDETSRATKSKRSSEVSGQSGNKIFPTRMAKKRKVDFSNFLKVQRRK